MNRLDSHVWFKQRPSRSFAHAGIAVSSQNLIRHPQHGLLGPILVTKFEVSANHPTLPGNSENRPVFIILLLLPTLQDQFVDAVVDRQYGHQRHKRLLTRRLFTYTLSEGTRRDNQVTSSVGTDYAARLLLNSRNGVSPVQFPSPHESHQFRGKVGGGIITNISTQEICWLPHASSADALIAVRHLRHGQIVARPSDANCV